MIYSNPEFFVLFFLSALSQSLARNYGLRLILLIAWSIIFYAWSGYFYTLIFLAVIAVSWVTAWTGHRYQRLKGTALAVGVTLIATNLIFWKYAPWITSNLQAWSPRWFGQTPLYLPLPVGISFFTLQAIAYLVDFNRGTTAYIRFPQFVLFKTFFPQLVAGPIVRAHQLVPQLEKLRSGDADDIRIGLSLFAFGFFKKVGLADRVAPLVDQVFLFPKEYNRWMLIQATLGYSVQIWADFSAYTDMGRGAARVLGIRLPENFLSPYLSRTPSEFWRRWHITLSEWLRDYIFYPLAMNLPLGERGGRLQMCVVAMLTMLISGLWHGAGWTFLLWGFYHGLLLVSETLLKRTYVSQVYSRYLPNWAQQLGLGAFMFVAILGSWIIFRAQSLSHLRDILAALVANQGKTTTDFLPNVRIGFVLCMIFQTMGYYSFKTKSLPLLDRLQNRLAQPLGAASRSPWAGLAIGGLVAALIAFTVFLRFGNVSGAFIYFQF